MGTNNPLEQEALQYVKDVLRLPVGQENVTIRSPLRSDDHNPSFSINTENGLWMDHGTGEKGNARILAERLGWKGERMKKMELKELGERIYPYTDAEGTVVFEVHRVDTVGSGKRIWVSGPEGVKDFKLPEPRPLYNLPKLVQSSGPVLVVEGEKCAEVDVPGYVVTTWSGGARAVNQSDWSILRDREVVVWPDADEPGLEAARRIRSLLPQAKILRVEGKPLGWDLYDCVTEGGDPLQFMQSCGLVSEDSGLIPPSRVGQIEENKKEDRGKGRRIEFADPSPLEEAIDGETVLDDIVRLARKYLVLPDGGAELIALWSLYTWCHDSFYVSPYLAFAAPQKGSGKTTALSFVSRLVHKAVAASSITPAALYRLIEEARPTLLIDEAETFIRKENPELKGILNSGFCKSSAYVIRAIDKDGTWEPRSFSTWCPKCFAFNGRLPDTLMDRSLVIFMQRKLRHEKVERLLEGRAEEEFQDVKVQLSSWAHQHGEELSTMDPDIPDELNNREADKWAPLLAIAEAVGGHWPDTARRLPFKIGREEDDDLKILLLRDIQRIFQNYGYSRLHSKDLASRLRELPDSPWEEMGSRGLTPVSLAGMLKPFRIKACQLKIEGKNQNGYTWEMFKPVLERYLPRELYSSTSQNNHLLVKEIEGRMSSEGRVTELPEWQTMDPLRSDRIELYPNSTFEDTGNYCFNKELSSHGREVEGELGKDSADASWVVSTAGGKGTEKEEPGIII